MNIRLPLFWSTWSRARGPDSATCAGLAALEHGRDYSYCTGSEQKRQKGLAIFFLELSKMLEKQWPAATPVRGFKHSPSDLLLLLNWQGCRVVVGNITRHEPAAVGHQFQSYRMQGSYAMLWPGIPFPWQLCLNEAGANYPPLGSMTTNEQMKPISGWV